MTTTNESNSKDAQRLGREINIKEVLRELRSIMPLRPLSIWEHETIAERQASRLHSLLDQKEPGVSLDWLSAGSDLIAVVLAPRWRMDKIAGMSTWQDGRWVIAVNRGDPPARRRFTLCHEFKHVLDANRDSITYKRISAPQRELIAHYFAACYLMPKPLLRHAWTSGIQDPEALAGLFKVSNDAMRRRLTHLQYLDDDTVRPTTSYFRQQASRLAEAA